MASQTRAEPSARSELEYPFEVHPSGTTQEVAPGVLWVRMPLPFALDHINLWLVADGAQWTLVDCGLATNTTRALWDEIFARDLAGRPVGRVIVTHYHPDHIGLAGWLSARLNVIPWMTKGEFLTAHAACHNVGGTGYARARAARKWRRAQTDAQDHGRARPLELPDRPGNPDGGHFRLA